MYHYVRPIIGSEYERIKGLEVKKFIEQIDYLSKEYQIIDVHELIAAINQNSLIPENSVVLSFDDGYKDHFKYVFPELKKREITATFFPVSSIVSQNTILDVNKIHFILAVQPNIDDLFNKVLKFLDLYRDEFSLESSISYLTKYFKVNRFDSKEVNFIKRVLQLALPIELRSMIVDDLFSFYVTNDQQSFSKELYASEQNLREMESYGMTIGSHGSSHFWLDSLSIEDQEKDIKKSITFLKKIGVDTSNLLFCYPYGAYNKETLEILSSLDFIAGFTCIPKMVDLKKDNILELPRIDTNDVSHIL